MPQEVEVQRLQAELSQLRGTIVRNRESLSMRVDQALCHAERLGRDLEGDLARDVESIRAMLLCLRSGIESEPAARPRLAG